MDLVKELESVCKERDQLKLDLAKVQDELTALKQQYEPSEEDVKKSVDILKSTVANEVCNSMVWRPSCKGNGARLSVTMPNVTRAEYRVLIGEERFDKMTKGKKAEKTSFTVGLKTEEEVKNVLGYVPDAGIRYGYLCLSFEGQGLRFTYDTTTRRLTVAGKYVKG